MSSNAPAKESKALPAAKQQRVPPDETFWKRYSPHHEFPLSMLSSAVLHGVGLTLLMFVALGILFAFRNTHPLPVDPVRLDTGGGGGSKTGMGDGPGVGKGPEAENVDAKATDEQPSFGEDVKRPDLAQPQIEALKADFADKDVRYIQESNAGRALAKLDRDARNKLRDGLNPGKGEGGRGSGGGKDTGKDKGKGAGTGEGKASLNQREKRMLRWSMSFDTRNGADYIKQLEALGAILAIPKPENPRDYYIVRDLSKRPAELLNEDLAQIQRIYWIDDKPHSVRAVMSTLGLQMTPSHFVAFMPEKLEAELADKELKFMGRKEEQIFETRFKVIRKGGTYDVIVVSQAPK
jgi:hypothetical protein